MTTPSPSLAGWVRRRGVIVVVPRFMVVIAATVGCRQSDSASATHGGAASAAAAAAGAPDDWMNKWHKETFDGQDPRKLWDQLAPAARAQLNKPGADPSDLTAKARALGADPETTFEFIRDQITLEPYAGVLRGARGTLAAGAGNALDRALLAQQLLKLNGVESRLVKGRLSDAQTDTLLMRFFGGSQVPKVLADLIAAPSEAAMKQQAAAFATAAGIPAQAAASLADHMRDEARGFWADADARRSSQLDSLDTQLRRASLKMAIDAGSVTARLKARLREHYWLQVREPGGGWREFDAAFADPRRGTAHASNAVALSDIPDSLYHKLAFTLIYETMTDGGPREDTVVAGNYASADGLFQTMKFYIQPTDLPADSNGMLALDPKRRVETLRGLKRFQGLLSVGGRVIAGRQFDLEGNTYDASSGPSSLKPAGTFADALGGSESAVRFVELRVAMRLTGPGREPMLQSRILLRGADLAAGTALPPIVEWEILLQPQWISGEFVSFHTLDQILDAGDALLGASQGNASQANVLSPNSPSPLALHFSLLRETAVAGILAARTGVRALIDAPMLTIVGNQLAGVDDKEGAITGARSLDIVENDITYVPISDTAAATAFGAALAQGVADCTLEDRVLREGSPTAVVKSGMAIVEQAALERRPVLVAKTQDIDALRSAGVTEDDINWIHDNESPDSRLVVATTASGSDAWWSIRTDGTAILRTKGGRGQAETEHAVHLGHVAMKVLCVLEIPWSLAGKSYFFGQHAGSADFCGIGMCLTLGFGLGPAYSAMGIARYGVAPAVEMGSLWADIFFSLFAKYVEAQSE